MSQLSAAAYIAAVTSAIEAHDIEAVPKWLILMALSGYGHEAEELRLLLVAAQEACAPDQGDQS